MKVSRQWVGELAPKTLSEPIGALVERIGAQLGEIEDVSNLGPLYKGILVAKIVKTKKLANSDHLQLCLINDDGVAKNVKRSKDGLVQVVCGAPNAKAGMLVAWIPPGVAVPSTVLGGQSLVLQSKEIRGEISNGMLASPKELSISDSHDGIMEIDLPAKPGQLLADVYSLNDYVINIENKMFTHRPDCFGQLGVAREIAGIQGIAFHSPSWYLKPNPKLPNSSGKLDLAVENNIPGLCPRFMATVVKDIEVKPSPVWLQTSLSRLGVRPINNIVDVTNYMMILTAQPLHAYDYDKVLALDKAAKTATIVVRRPQPEEKLILLGNKQVVLDSEDIVISTKSEAIGLGGVMGGASTQVDDKTKNIILECANFDMYTIRRMSMAHGLFTDAVTRFSKGQSPAQTDRVILKTLEMLIEVGGGQVKLASEVIDVRGDLKLPKTVEVSAGFINERLGLDLPAAKMKKILTNVEIGVELIGTKLKIQPPFWRTDIEIPEDVVEEVGRLLGYDKLPVELPKRTLKPASKNKTLEVKSMLRNVLSGAGANELLNYSFVHGSLLRSAGQDSNKAFQLSNALSPDLQFYRMSLTPSLLEKVHSNLKSDFIRSDDNEFAIYEINVTHNKQDKDDETLPKEWPSLALVFAADDKTVSRKYQGAAFYAARRYLSFLYGHNATPLREVELASLKDSDLEASYWGQAIISPFEPSRSSALIDETGQVRGVLGEYRQTVKQSLKLPDFVSGFEVDLSIFDLSKNNSHYFATPHFPKVVQDITLRVAVEMKFVEVFDFVWQEISHDKPKDTQFSVGPIDIYAPQKSDFKQITLRLWISAFDRTLTSSSVNKLLDHVAAKAQVKLGAERV